MAHLDKRMDANKDSTGQDGGRVKDGASGNTSESREYEANKNKDLPDGASPDVPKKTGQPGKAS